VLNGIIENYDLTRFDSGNDGGVIDTGTGGNENANENSGEDNNSANDDNSSNSNSSTYTVQAGDSVWLIADQNGITMNQLRDWNNIQNDFVYPGQKLTVSSGSSSSNNNSSSNTHHKVKSGDSLWMISQEYDISVSRLKSINNLKSDTIFIGQNLKVS